MRVEGQVGIGVLGVGSYGMLCLDVLAAMPEVSIVAVADVDVAKARLVAAQHSARSYSTLEKMLDDPYIHMVILATPPYLHAQQARAAIRAGKHVFCDAPLALSLEDVDELLAEAARAGVLIGVDHVMRFNPFYETVRAIREDRVLGALQHIDLTDHFSPGERPPDHWFWDDARSGGIWLEHCLPFFDALIWMTGESGEIVGAQSFARSDGVLQRVQAIGRFGESAAHIYHSLEPAGVPERTIVRLTFEGGTITLREWLPTVIEIIAWWDIAPLIIYLPGSVTPEKYEGNLKRLRAYSPQGSQIVMREGLQRALRSLTAPICNPSIPVTITHEDIQQTMRLALAASR